jgi:selenocysteine lyase/cysteine desulfurase
MTPLTSPAPAALSVAPPGLPTTPRELPAAPRELRAAPPAMPNGRPGEADRLVDRIRRGILGDGQPLDGPYGRRRITYADDTASGRAVDFIEDYIRHSVLPYYANTHTESSGTGLATGRLREQARELIHAEVGATANHAVIFCGSGSTAAVNKLVTMLGLARSERRPWSPVATPEPAERAVVFVGPYEHHSNELPWRESAADVVVIGADPDGRIDLADLDRNLRRYADRPLRIGSFSAGSNVTGLITDTDPISALLHAYGAWACWDYAAAAPYLPIRMAESAPGRADQKDAVFLSPHKFVGGPQTPGILVVDRALTPPTVPTASGGGTITFVGPYTRSYSPDPVHREEAGTPAIVESIRAGLAFSLKRAVGPAAIHARHDRLLRRALDRWRAEPGLELLGNTELPRLPIVSFRIHHEDRLLHHNFVVALLNDLFGIQARGGCSCAGPYGHRLLWIDEAASRAIGAEVDRGRLGVKPGWARVSFNYFLTDTVADFIIDAVTMVARYGHRLLGEYEFFADSGLWRHRRASVEPPLRLPDPAAIALADSPPGPRLGLGLGLGLGEEVLAGYLIAARSIFAAHPDEIDHTPPDLPPTFEALRTFHLPPACVGGQR